MLYLHFDGLQVVASKTDDPAADATFIGSGAVPPFGASPAVRSRQYREFLAQSGPEEDRFFDNLESPAGSKEFVRQLVRKKGLYLPKTGRPMK